MPSALSRNQTLPVAPAAAPAAENHPHKPRTRTTIALVGNPNTGKTTLFNALTGFRRHVANYPGVTVDVGRGPVRGALHETELLDLPGSYSLAAVSPDEMVVSNVCCGRYAGQGRPDVILAILDASNLPRNLYLLSQVFGLGLPVVVALNMIDIARGRGIAIDHARLSARLGVPVVPVIATKSETMPPLVRALEHAADNPPPHCRVDLPPALLEAAEGLGESVPGGLERIEAIRTLLEPDGFAEGQFLERGGSREALSDFRARLASEQIDPAVEVKARYAWVGQMLEGAIDRPKKPVRTASDRLDAILTHRIWGGLLLFVVLGGLFQAIFTFAAYPMEWIGELFGALGTWAGSLLPDGMIRSLLVDGVIGGVGGVLVFLPQIMILFASIAILEDCGYMARAAYMMDRAMRALGLSGRSFIPLLSGFACAIPAIMGTRAIADRRERLVAILIIPFMSCSARLPVYVLLIAAFVPATHYLGGTVGLQGLVMLGMYLVGVVFAFPIAWLLKKTVFAGPNPGFVLELPSYKLPRLRALWQRTYSSGRHFIVRAGTIILLVNMVVWALGYFPRSDANELRVKSAAATQGWDAERTESELAAAFLQDSYLGRIGRGIEPVIRPIGWDWRVGMAVIASFPAREVVIGALGTIYGLGSDVDEESAPLHEKLQEATWPGGERRVFNLPVALSLMVFFALCAQCSSTLVVLGREMGSWKWPVVSFVGMTVIAYFAAWATAAIARSLA